MYVSNFNKVISFSHSKIPETTNELIEMQINGFEYHFKALQHAVVRM